MRDLAPCAARSNCVCSRAGDARHAVEPLRFAGSAGEAWAAARSVVAGLPRTRIVEESDGYLRAAIRSRVFGFVDDLELQLAPEEGCIHVRSAARIGYADFGVNRRRVEEIRDRLRARGVG